MSLGLFTNITYNHIIYIYIFPEILKFLNISKIPLNIHYFCFKKWTDFESIQNRDHVRKNFQIFLQYYKEVWKKIQGPRCYRYPPAILVQLCSDMRLLEHKKALNWSFSNPYFYSHVFYIHSNKMEANSTASRFYLPPWTNYIPLSPLILIDASFFFFFMLLS